MGCWDAKEKIIPPASETAKDLILKALGYEEQTMIYDGVKMTILVKCEEEEPSEEAVVGTAVVGTAIAG